MSDRAYVLHTHQVFNRLARLAQCWLSSNRPLHVHYHRIRLSSFLRGLQMSQARTAVRSDLYRTLSQMCTRVSMYTVASPGPAV